MVDKGGSSLSLVSGTVSTCVVAGVGWGYLGDFDRKSGLASIALLCGI